MIKLIDICKTYNPHTVNETKLFENFQISFVSKFFTMPLIW